MERGNETHAASITGYVTATARDSKVLHDRDGTAFIEQIMPGAFARAIERDTGNQIYLDLDHDKGRILARRSADTLCLYEDNIGLAARALVTDEEVIQLKQENRLRGWSFMFRPIKERREPGKDGIQRRFVYDLELLAVTLVSDRKEPAYSGTQIDGERSLGDAQVRCVILSELLPADEAGAKEQPDMRLQKCIMKLIDLN